MLRTRGERGGRSFDASRSTDPLQSAICLTARRGDEFRDGWPHPRRIASQDRTADKRVDRQQYRTVHHRRGAGKPRLPVSFVFR